MVVRPGRQHGGGGPGGSGGALGAGGYGSVGVGAGDSANDGWVSPSKHQSMSERLYSNRYYLAGALVLVVGDVVGCLTLDEKAQSENGKIVPVLTAAVVRLIANAILVTGAVWVGSLSIRKPWAEVGDDEAATEDDTSSESEARVKDSARNKVAAIQKMKATGASDLLVPLLMEPQQPLSLSALCEVSTTSVLAPPKAGTDSDSETDNLNTNCKDIKEQGCSASKSKVPTTTDSTQTGDVTVNLEDALNDDDEASKTDFSGRQRRAKPGGAITFANLAEELQFKRHVKRVERVAHYRRNVLIGCLFGIVVASNFVNGITCVTFPYPTDENGNITHDGFVMGFVLALMVLACNLQFLAFQRFVFNMTRDDGVLIPKIHAHKIYFNLKFTRSWCDVCRTLIRHEGYRCKVCQFDCCVNCFKRQGKHSDEGLLRCDNGPVPVKELTTFSYFLRAIRLMAPFMPLVIAALSCLVVNQGVDLMIPQYQGKIFDNVIKGDAEGFKSVLTVYVICNVLMAMFRGLQDLCVTVVWRYLRFEARMKMFEAVLKQDLAFFDGLMTGQITSRMNSDVEAMVQPCRTIMNVLLSNVIRLIGGFVMCAATSWKLTVLSFTSIAPIIYLTGLYARWSRSINLDIWQNLADGSAVATEAINNIRSVRAYGTDVSEHNKYKISMEIARSKGMKDSYASAGVGLVNNYLDFATGVLILGYGGAVVLNSEGKQLTLGNLITFQLYWNMMNYAYQALNGVINSMIRAAAAAERVFELIECTPVIEKGPDDLDYHKGIKLADEEMRGSLELSGVNFTYQMRPEKQVLKDINLRITPGTVCAFVGRSGGGKSTLIHLLLRFYNPQEGSVMFDGIDVRDFNLGWYRSQIGLVAQDTHLFNMTVEENICYGYGKPYTRAELEDAASKACAHEFIMGLDDQYQTKVGERGCRLSGGQKQRIAVARVLLRRPRLLLLDEATSALDAESEGVVQEALDNLMKEMGGRCTIILVAHRLSSVVHADKICVMNEGQIVEVGNHQSLLKEEGIYSNLVSRQMYRDSNNIQEANIDVLVDDDEATVEPNSSTNNTSPPE